MCKSVESFVIGQFEEKKRIWEYLEGILCECRFLPHRVWVPFEEAIVNALKHGNKMDTSKRVVITIAHGPQCLVIAIQDEGKGFSPEDLPDPLAPENLEKPGGRGVLLIRKMSDWSRWNERGNMVTIGFGEVTQQCLDALLY